MSLAIYRVISADDHVIEPPELWTSRVEPRFKDRAPSIVRDENGDWWVCDGQRVSSIGGGAQTGLRFEQPEKLTRTDKFERIRLGGYIPDERIKDMDADGVEVSIVYPTVGCMLYSVQDTALLTGLFRAYNGWIAEFCAAFPDRLKGIAMVNVDDVGEGVRELTACAKLGFAGAMITVYPPEGKAYHLPEYESFWAAAQDLSMPLSLHAATNRPSPSQLSSLTVRPSQQANVDYWVRVSLGDIILSGVFERYPDLRVGAVEHELSWVPHFLDRLDYQYTQRAPRELDYRFKEDALPSDYFHRNVSVGFQEDALGITLRNIIGVDNLLWGSDYPHQESTFPRSKQILEEILADCTEEEKTKIAGGNAARIYRLD